MDHNVTIQLREFLDDKFRPVYEGIAEIKEQLRRQGATVTDIDRRVVRLENQQADMQDEIREQKEKRQKLLWWVVTMASGTVGYLLIQFIELLR